MIVDPLAVYSTFNETEVEERRVPINGRDGESEFAISVILQFANYTAVNAT